MASVKKMLMYSFPAIVCSILARPSSGTGFPKWLGTAQIKNSFAVM